MLAILFVLFAGLAICCAIVVVAPRNLIYSAISRIGVFVSLACLSVMLAAPFIAAVQVIVYAGAIMVLVVFVIMLLNVEQEEHRRPRLKFLVPAAMVMAAILIAETTFIIFYVKASPNTPTEAVSNTGLTASIGTGLFTKYLLPFEITSILLLMAIVGAMTLTRRPRNFSSSARIVPGAQVLAMDVLNSGPEDLRPVEADTSAEAARLLGVQLPPASEEDRD